MDAEKMFEDLGFKRSKTYQWLSYDIVNFNLLERDYQVVPQNDVVTMSIELHQAIHQQLIELKWINR